MPWSSILGGVLGNMGSLSLGYKSQASEKANAEAERAKLEAELKAAEQKQLTYIVFGLLATGCIAWYIYSNNKKT